MPIELANSTNRRICLLVLGMHRSGTSALTGTLGLLGVTLPEVLVEGNIYNPKGHFESLHFLEINENVLAALNSSWYDISSIEFSHLDPALLTQWKDKLLEVLQNRFSKSSLFVLKDPRLSRFLPLTLPVVRDVGASICAIICLRHPLEVAQSLATRDGMALSHGIGLWLRYMLEAELNSRGLLRIFVRYSDLLQDWQSVISQIEYGFGFALPRPPASAATSVNEFLDKALRHHVANTKESKKGLGNYGPAIKCYRAITKLRSNPNDKNAMHQLDLIRSSFDQAANLFGGALTGYFSKLLEMQQEKLAAAQDIAALRQEMLICTEQEQRLWELNRIEEERNANLKK